MSCRPLPAALPTILGAGALGAACFFLTGKLVAFRAALSVGCFFSGMGWLEALWAAWSCLTGFVGFVGFVGFGGFPSPKSNSPVSVSGFTNGLGRGGLWGGLWGGLPAGRPGFCGLRRGGGGMLTVWGGFMTATGFAGLAGRVGAVAAVVTGFTPIRN